MLDAYLQGHISFSQFVLNILGLHVVEDLISELPVVNVMINLQIIENVR